MGECMTQQALLPQFALALGGADSAEHNYRYKAER